MDLSAELYGEIQREERVKIRVLNQSSRVSSSFRDPSGYIFTNNGTLYRQVNLSYSSDYDLLLGSGLYDSLVSDNLLIPHAEENANVVGRKEENYYKIIRPEFVPFISYPYEWCFSQLKDAALVLLKIQNIALDYGMTLKDASSYNFQRYGGGPVLIDTLSFEQYREGAPWIAFRQFCQHFLAPLVLSAKTDFRLQNLLRIYVDGVPLDLTSKLMPLQAKLNPLLLSYIGLHAKSQKAFEGKVLNTDKYKMSLDSLRALLRTLESTIRNLKLDKKYKTFWQDYYDDVSYTGTAFDEKKKLVQEWSKQIRPKMTWDIGANTGVFSRALSNHSESVVSMDYDFISVERNYEIVRKDRLDNIHPLIMDLTNPSPNLGWASKERMSLVDRGPADLTLALALIHHLRIGNNVPFFMIAEFFAAISDHLIIEFVPKDDPRVERMLLSRKDIFDDYNVSFFEKTFSKYFKISLTRPISDSKRVLYLMKRL